MGIFVVLYGAIAIGAVTSSALWSPKLALDLAGGTEIVLKPKPIAGNAVHLDKTQLDVAVSVIRQRVNGGGISEAEVTTQGTGQNQTIDVAIPGKPSAKTKQLVEQSAQLTFRPVLVVSSSAPEPATSATPTPSTTSSAGATATPSASGSAKAGATTKDGAKKAATKTTPSASATNSRILPKALTKGALKAAGTSTPAATTAPAATGAAAVPTAVPSVDPSAVDPGNAATDTTNTAATGTASDTAQITQAIGDQFTKLTCTKDEMTAIQSQVADPKKPFVTCDQNTQAKYILGPVELTGDHVKSASSGLGTNSQGFNTGQWQINLSFDGYGTKVFANVTRRLASLTGAQNQFAIVLDGLVVSDPGTNEAIPSGTAQISGGNITEKSANLLASQLKFGALPVSFQVETSNQISAVLGGEQLKRGLLAGLIGLILVVIYSLLQYRALGLVTIFSLGIAGALTYGTVCLLSWTEGYRLSLAGVTGLIVAIGITADSFIVYFERVRDEVREGRPLHSAVEAAWKRARRTILVSDGVSFLAALVLYFLAIGSVRGFAFTLGLTTLIDVLVVFLFTKPTVVLLSRTKFFGSGHPLSGFGAEQLGRLNAPAYAGRGRIRDPQTQSIAARRAAADGEGTEGGWGSAADDGDDDPGGGSGGRVSSGAAGAAGAAGSNGRVSAVRTSGNRRDV